MADKPIIFSAPMVRALLEGRKTMTRRVLKPQPIPACAAFKKVFAEPPYFEARDANDRPLYAFPYPKGCMMPFPRLQYGIGDRLWVREGWAETTNVNEERDWPDRPHLALEPGARAVIYRADGGWTWRDDDGFETERSYWRPSIHMPRWASRLTLHVTAVKVERLQEISDDDVIAEGFEIWGGGDIDDDTGKWRRLVHTATEDSIGMLAPDAFGAFWTHLHGPDAWALNSWVVAPTFTVHLRNIDKEADDA